MLGARRTSKQPGLPEVPLAQQTWLPTQLAPPLQLHCPPTHCSPWRQLWPQAPQLLKLELVSTQPTPQQVWPVAQATGPHRQVGVPPAVVEPQVSPVPHLWPQLPQLLGSLLRLAQPDEQQASPALQMTPLHAQLPVEQASGVVQPWPQVPQLALSLLGSTQVLPPQQTWGKVQLVPPQAQTPVVEQVPSAQQTAVAPVQAAPPPQLQAPATQVSPGLQA